MNGSRPAIRLTFATGMVLQALARGHRYGFEIMDVSGLPDGTVYPALRRLDAAGAVTSKWEDNERAHREKRPARRYYLLTGEGERLLASARERFPGLNGSLASTAGQPRLAT